MSEWQKVGSWLKDNAGTGLALVGSLLTSNAPGAIAAGISLVSSATGTDSPNDVLEKLKTSPESVVKLKELAIQDEANIREHIREMYALKLADEQAEHHETQETIRGGDKADDKFIRWTRPGQSWLSLAAGLAYIFTNDSPDLDISLVLFAMPWSYAGLRQVGKGIESFVSKKPKA